MTDIVIIILVTTLAVGGVKSAYALTAERASRLFATSNARHWLERTAGAVLIGTGLVLIYHNLATVTWGR